MKNKQELLRKLGNVTQISGIRRFIYADGKAKGMSAIEMYNASGLRATIIQDEGLNIHDFSYKGINFAFHSKNGLVGNQFYSNINGEFSNYWPGGMLYTCGLTNTGPACIDRGINYPEHGSIGMLPAENVSIHQEWIEDDYVLEVKGDLLESAVCGTNLLLSRRISLTLEGKELAIEDVISNREPSEQDLMFLYHINLGYPLVDVGARFVKSEGKLKSRTKEQEVGIQNYHKITEPMDNKYEEVFFHENTIDSDGFSYAAIINDKLKLGCYVKYAALELPVLVQWKNMCSHDYVVGIEPSNSYIMGRELERENGTIRVMKGYEKVSYSVYIGVLDGAQEIEAFLEKIGKK